MRSYLEVTESLRTGGLPLQAGALADLDANHYAQVAKVDDLSAQLKEAVDSLSQKVSQIATLGAENATLKEQVAGLTQERDALKAAYEAAKPPTPQMDSAPAGR